MPSSGLQTQGRPRILLEHTASPSPVRSDSREGCRLSDAIFPYNCCPRSPAFSQKYPSFHRASSFSSFALPFQVHAVVDILPDLGAGLLRRLPLPPFLGGGTIPTLGLHNISAQCSTSQLVRAWDPLILPPNATPTHAPRNTHQALLRLAPLLRLHGCHPQWSPRWPSVPDVSASPLLAHV